VPAQWALDQADALADDIIARAATATAQSEVKVGSEENRANPRTNAGPLLSESEFSRHVAPLIYKEMRSQGFEAPPAMSAGVIGRVPGSGENSAGTECDFNQLLRRMQEEDVGQHHRRYRRRAWH